MKKHRLSKKEIEMLSDMQNYCEANEDCRRQTFSTKFGLFYESSSSLCSAALKPQKYGNSNRKSFSACRTMCDNCVAATHGDSSRRGCFDITKTKKQKRSADAMGSTSAQNKRPAFVKASEIISNAGCFMKASSILMDSKKDEVVVIEDGDSCDWISRPDRKDSSLSRVISDARNRPLRVLPAELHRPYLHSSHKSDDRGMK